MIDADVSHSFEFKLFTRGTNVGGGVVWISISVSSSFPCLCISLLYLQALCSLFFLTSGASCPKMVGPTDEGGGLLAVYVFALFALFL
jgi:hypothetical protein